MIRNFTRCMGSKSTSHRPPISVFGIEGRYVTALYSAAHKKNELDKVETALRQFAKELSKPVVMDFIETSMISRPEKAILLNEVASKAGMPSCAGNFLALVAENGRLKLLRRIINVFLHVMVAHRNMALCEIITAKPLDEGTRDILLAVLKKLAKGKNVQLTERVDQNIIGGLVLGIEDKHIDLSIARKIQIYTDELKRTL